MVERCTQVANPKRSDEIRSERVKAIEAQLKQNPKSAELLMELGLALSEQKLFREAVEAYSKAIALEPFCGILYRHRGHRHISCWEYEEAVADFVVASRLIPENWDAWYHLGLSYYLLGNYAEAEKAYKRCYEITDRGTDNFCAITDWYWRTLIRIGKKEEADKLIETIDPTMDPELDWVGYSRNVLMYRGVIKPEDLIKGRMTQDQLSAPTMCYCLSNYYAVMGDMEKSNEALKLLLDFCDAEWWSAFGYLAGREDAKARGLL